MTTGKYTTDFNRNVKIAKESEGIALELLAQLVPDGDFVDVSNVSDYYHLGDIMDAKTGRYYDVKDDGVVHRTGNVFCEERKEWRSGQISDGWMYSNYDNLVILDGVSNHIYVLDFSILKKIYKDYRYVTTNMGDNYTSGYCVPLKACREAGAMLYESAYEYNKAWDCYDVA